MNTNGYSQQTPNPNEPGYPPAAPPSQANSWNPNNDNVPPPGSGGFMDPVGLGPNNFSFNEASVRKGFLRKIYLIVMGQLLFVFGTVALFLFHKPTQVFSEKNPGLILAACIITLVIIIAMAYCESARRKFPNNFICLIIFTAAESFLFGAIAGYYNAEPIFVAVGITAILCLVQALSTLQTKYDFTALGGVLLAAFVCLMIFGVVVLFWRAYIIQTMFACFGAFSAFVFLIHDMQLMMGGKHKYSVNPDEYIFAVLNLYVGVYRNRNK